MWDDLERFWDSLQPGDYSILRKQGLVGKRESYRAGNTPSSDSVLMMSSVLFFTFLSNFPQGTQIWWSGIQTLLLVFTQVGYLPRLSLWTNYLVKAQEGCLLDNQPPLLCYSRPHSSIPTPSLSIVTNLNCSQHKARGSLYHSSQLAWRMHPIGQLHPTLGKGIERWLTQQLGALAALAKDLSSVPKPMSGGSRTTCNSHSKGSKSSSGFTLICTYTQIHNCNSHN